MIAPQGLEIGEKILWKCDETCYLAFFSWSKKSVCFSYLKIEDLSEIQRNSGNSMQFWTIVGIAYFFVIVCIVCKNSGNSMFVASLYMPYKKYS